MAYRGLVIEFPFAHVRHRLRSITECLDSTALADSVACTRVFVGYDRKMITYSCDTAIVEIGNISVEGLPISTMTLTVACYLYIGIKITPVCLSVFKL